MPLPLTERRRAAARAIALATLIALLLIALRRLDTLPNGLRGQYFPNIDWSGEPAKTVVDPTPSTGALLGANAGTPAPAFSVAWSGWIIAPRDDAYTFATVSDDGSWVFVDGQLVLDNGGAHASTTKSGLTIRLPRGPHSLFVKYFQNDGGVELVFLWQRGAGPFEPVPSWALRPRRIDYPRFVVDRTLEVAGALAPWGWTAALIAAALFGFWPELRLTASRVSAAKRRLAEEGAWPALAWILAGSTALNLIGLWWGLPGGIWVGDELIPQAVLSGWAQYFSFGWWDKYPPLQYYILTLAYLPVLALDGLFSLAPPVVETLLMVDGRIVSIVMAAGTVLVTFFAGRRAFGARAGLFAAAMLAVSAPFVYYAKAANVDVPYVFWFALSLIFYLRVLAGGAPSDYIWWGVTAALAVCTKDQAYGLFLLMPVPVTVEMWRRKEPIVRRLVSAGIAAGVTFALSHNLLFNTAGFVTHFTTITGHASRGYRAFEPTLGGRLELLGATIRSIPLSWAWPMTIICGAGVAVALVTPARRRMAVWLLVPAVSYYLGFINVVLYNYDRFLLPVFVVLAVFGGYALDRFTPRSSRRVWQRAAVAAVFGYTFLYSASVDALMLSDSRYTVERWLRAHVGADDLVGTTSIATYMPRTTGVGTIDVSDLAMLDTIRPRFVLLNPDYTLIEPRHTPLGQVITMLQRGKGRYRLAFSARTSGPWSRLPGAHEDLVGDRRDPEIVSFLRNINPTIEIYERIPDR